MERRGSKTNQVQEAIFAMEGKFSADLIRTETTSHFGGRFDNKFVRSVIGNMKCVEPNGKNFQVTFDPLTKGSQLCDNADCHFTKSGTSGCDRYRTAGKQLSSTDVSI